MKNVYYIRLDKGRVPLGRFNYPCEEISNSLLNGRLVCIHGDDQDLKEGLVRKFRNRYHGCEMLVDFQECTDLIVTPSCLPESNNTPETYFQELYYYHDVVCECLHNNGDKIKNIILLLPRESEEHSTNYKRMADYATVGFGLGLSKRYVQKSVNTYVLLVEREIDEDALFDVLSYLLSDNANHFVGKTFQLG